jgi:phosphoribosylaminoimidazole-succinocarboxamide synthase
MDAAVVTRTDLPSSLPLVARGKVRDLYAVDDRILLFVATDRISAYDVVMENVPYLIPDSAGSSTAKGSRVFPTKASS